VIKRFHVELAVSSVITYIAHQLIFLVERSGFCESKKFKF